MSDMKCPFCQQELRPISVVDHHDERCVWYCPNCATNKRLWVMANERIWQELIRTRKALDVATGFIKRISQTVINDCDNQYVVLGNFKKLAQDTLEQITALEQGGNNDNNS